MSKRWSKDEIDKLYELWGKCTLPEIAKKLGRTINAVNLKRKRIGLSGQFSSYEILTAQKVAKLMGVDIHTVTDYWIKKCGLPARKKQIGEKRKYYVIRVESLLRWLEKNQDKWNSLRTEQYLFTGCKEWYIEKKLKDEQREKRQFQRYTKMEDEKIKMLYYQRNYTYKQIGQVIGRSECSVSHRMNRIIKKKCEKNDATIKSF